MQLDEGVLDRFIWRWSVGGTYSASTAYRAFFVGMSSLRGAKELWRVKAPVRTKFFFWLALHQRLWTADRRRRHNLQDNGDCALCDQMSETVDHLLLGCVYSWEVWVRILSPIALIVVLPASSARIED